MKPATDCVCAPFLSNRLAARQWVVVAVGEMKKKMMIAVSKVVVSVQGCSVSVFAEKRAALCCLNEFASTLVSNQPKLGIVA